MQYMGNLYQANYWTQTLPTNTADWTFVRACLASSSSSSSSSGGTSSGSSSSSGGNVVSVELDFNNTHDISPLIYGFNQDHESLTSDNNFTARRLGGNRMSVFNWENGASNSGHDQSNYPNDNRIASLVGLLWADKDKPGAVYQKFHQDNLDAGLTSIITVPLLGWVAADKDGGNKTVPPSARWDELVIEKDAAFSLTPDTTDNKVYVDESIHFLKQTFGSASTANGVKYISLGNEPGLWNSGHDIVTGAQKVNAADYVQKVIATAIAVKSVDPDVQVIVGELAGINLYDLRTAPDWPTVGSGYDWFVSYLLDELKQASDAQGYRLADIVAFHNYPQHKVDANGNFNSGGTVVKTSTSTAGYIRETRMDFARSMWDTSYIEPSWLTASKLNNQPNNIIGRIQNSIDTYYPGTKIMLGEFDYGHDTDISHGIAIADLLGVLADKDVTIATRWDLNVNNDGIYTNAAYKLFRNYDGSNGGYGDRAVPTTFTHVDGASVWASVDTSSNDLHLIILNKDINNSRDFSINLGSVHSHSIKGVYGFDGSSSDITARPLIGAVSGGKLDITLPKLGAYHVVLTRN